MSDSVLKADPSEVFPPLPRARSVNAVLGELNGLVSECGLPNWDGHGARPVLAKTIRQAQRFVEALPPGTRAPSVGAEPDGHVTLEWHRSARQTLSVSISPDGELHYAALLGASKTYGTEAFFGDVPECILVLISRVEPK